MKTTRTFGVAGLSLIALLFMANSSMAQRQDSIRTGHRVMRTDFHPRSDRGIPGISNLTDDQKAKIKEQRLALGKESMPLTNQLAEKKAHLRTLQTTTPADLNAVNATIDDITKVETQLMKKRAANHEAIRKLLTDEQRLAFDSHGGFQARHGRIHGGFQRGHRN